MIEQGDDELGEGGAKKKNMAGSKEIQRGAEVWSGKKWRREDRERKGIVAGQPGTAVTSMFFQFSLLFLRSPQSVSGEAGGK